jgi:hypothetical protein
LSSEKKAEQKDILKGEDITIGTIIKPLLSLFLVPSSFFALETISGAGKNYSFFE